ncbi:MAG: BON domain-containing protein [Deltaproteobacteria bacterium]|nr:BON domain-containing protein [Deltaproteobacteria bacterium]
MSRALRAVALAVLLVLAGCQAIEDLKSNPKFEDAKILATVKAQLAREDRSTMQEIDVNVDDGIVKLKGNISSADKKNKAGEIAAKVRGVKSVVNNIEVKP